MYDWAISWARLIVHGASYFAWSQQPSLYCGLQALYLITGLERFLITSCLLPLKMGKLPSCPPYKYDGIS